MGIRRGTAFRLLVNPAAGLGRARRLLPRLRRCLDRLGVEHDCRVSEGPGHLTALASQFNAREGPPALPVVVGGDGSLNEVLNGFPPGAPPLGIVPAGRGDDIARSLGIPSGVEAACASLVGGEAVPIDVVDTGGRLFAGIGGAGVDSEVTRRANRKRLPLPGAAAYAFAVAGALASFRPYPFRITADRWTWEGNVMFAGVANAPAYGGGMVLSPASRMDDGVIEICIVEEMSRLALLANFPRLYRGTHISHPKVRLLTARQVRIESGRPADFYADGEYQSPLPVSLSVRPSSLRVIVPPRGRG